MAQNIESNKRGFKRTTAACTCKTQTTKEDKDLFNEMVIYCGGVFHTHKEKNYLKIMRINHRHTLLFTAYYKHMVCLNTTFSGSRKEKIPLFYYCISK